MGDIVIEQINVLSDNYIYLVHDVITGATAAIDPAEAAPVLSILETRGWTLSHIFNTHHHNDHTGGNLELKEATGAMVVGARRDAERIPGLDLPVDHGDTIVMGHVPVSVIATPGHTSGHLSYWIDDCRALFCGDTLFSLGCGRLFEGTPAQMWASLRALRDLPADTQIYCAHEYTAANGRFARLVEQNNPALQAYLQQVDHLRADNRPTIPSTLAVEKAANPFLRADIDTVAQAVGMAPGTDPVHVFAELRHRKDVF